MLGKVWHLVQLFDGNTEAAQSVAKEAIDAGSVSSTAFAIYGGKHCRRQCRDCGKLKPDRGGYQP